MGAETVDCRVVRSRSPVVDPCYVYEPGFIDARARGEILAWLATLVPLWELRYSTRRPLPPGRAAAPAAPAGVLARQLAVRVPGLLRAAAADPRRRGRRRAVPAGARPAGRPDRAPRPRRLPAARRAAALAAQHLPGQLLRRPDRRRPRGRCRAGRRAPRLRARPGRHRCRSASARGSSSCARGAPDAPPVRTEWLEDGSLQVFGGPRWKDDLLHRVQRVDDKHALDLPPAIAGFRTRRVNFTFRYVPDEHVVRVRRPAGRRARRRPRLRREARRALGVLRRGAGRRAPGAR